MKSLSLLLIAILLKSFLPSLHAQTQFEGKWSGVLKISSTELGLVFNIASKDGQLEGTMDSPNQGAEGIPIGEIKTKGDSIFVDIPTIKLLYSGLLIDKDNIDGRFSQHGQAFPLKLSKTLTLNAVQKPQEPLAPFPYKSEDLRFENKSANIHLSGTLTLPEGKGPFPAIVLVSGSGPQDRDETLLGHKPFLVLADYFTRNGYAVLRYDDRGVNKSEGDFSGATSADFATDALAAVQYLQTRKDINKKKVGIMGHSEGGMIATKLAASNKELAYIVMLAGPGVQGKDVLLQQQEVISKGSGVPESEIPKSLAMNQNIYDIVVKNKDTASMKQKLRVYLNHEFKEGNLPYEEGTPKDTVINTYLSAVSSPWMVYFIQYDPQVDLAKIKIPTLALIGSKDCQVVPKYNIPALQTAFKKGGNTKATVMELDGLNHLFQEANTGMPQEYSTIEQTFAPSAMKTILDWLNKTLNVK